MTQQTDDLEAVRAIVGAVQGFDAKDQQRIFRWAAEKLGLPQPFGAPLVHVQSETPSPPAAGASTGPPGARDGGPGRDIRSFVAEKSPRSDVQFAATIAYYYQFVAPESERKGSITKDDLLDACRKVGRKRPPNPRITLHNASNAGLLDLAGKGAFSINSVGENLVAVTLPSAEDSTGARQKKRQKRKAASARAERPKASRKSAEGA